MAERHRILKNSVYLLFIRLNNWCTFAISFVYRCKDTQYLVLNNR